jgi:myo-inositol catabolism protein IolH
LLELPALVAKLGYQWIELSPREDFTPFFTHPRVGDATVREFKQALHSAGVGVASVLPLYRWSGPEEDERRAAVRYWKRAIEIIADLGVDTMNSKFNGNPREAEVCERQFWISMEELLPIFEKEGIRLVLEPHPDDWEQDGKRALDLIQGINSPNVSFLYCTPHTFHQGNDVDGILDKAGSLTTMCHIADAYDHTASSGLRYIVNPPGALVTVHQHLDVGQGEVDLPGSSKPWSATALTGRSALASSPGGSAQKPRERTCSTPSSPTWPTGPAHPSSRHRSGDGRAHTEPAKPCNT